MVWIGTCNIGRNKTIATRETAIRKVCRAYHGITGWQEIDEGDAGDEHAVLKGAMPNFSWANFSSREPIGAPRGWKLTAQRYVKTSKGIAGVSPQRGISEGFYQSRWSKRKRFAVLNNHPIAGAHTKPGQKMEAARTKAWEEHDAKLRARIDYYVKLGVDVVVTGDFNHPKMPKLHPRQRTLVHSGLDYILLIPGKGSPLRWTKKATKTVALNIDGHKGHAVRMKIKIAKGK